jgi:lipopolysaccharide/colanic/teichoic acid biosynthesis glycosyltransferase
MGGEVRSTWCRSRGKRAVDLVISVGLAPIVIPMIGVLCLGSAVAFRTNPLFTQERRGMDERRFSVVKIRSLPASFPNWQITQELDLQGIRGWSHFLRATHLDELPQVLNIIAGTMSIVGPRPMIDPVLAELDDADRALRAKVKPGLTGAWQTSTAGALPLSDHPELDNHYVASATLSADIHIMWLTVRSVLLGRSPEPADLVDRLSWTDSPVNCSSAA